MKGCASGGTAGPRGGGKGRNNNNNRPRNVAAGVVPSRGAVSSSSYKCGVGGERPLVLQSLLRMWATGSGRSKT
eukprot:6156928-Pyramimonas_sp.AAC.1